MDALRDMEAALSFSVEHAYRAVASLEPKNLRWLQNPKAGFPGVKNPKVAPKP
jgi:hypothetical protein